MRIILIFLILFLNYNYVKAQDQETIWAQDDFEKNYKKENYNIDKSRVVKLNPNKYAYKEDTILIEGNNELKLLVENNLLTYLYQNNDSVARRYYIQNLKKIKYNSNNKTKRYSIWISSSCRKELGEICLLNPTLYFFEIESSSENNCKSFYNEATLTYLSKPMIIL